MMKSTMNKTEIKTLSKARDKKKTLKAARGKQLLRNHRWLEVSGLIHVKY